MPKKGSQQATGFWDLAKKIAVEVESWPEWKKGSITVRSSGSWQGVESGGATSGRQEKAVAKVGQTMRKTAPVVKRRARKKQSQASA